VWHVSVSVIDRQRGTILPGAMSMPLRRRAQAECRQQLAGVGSSSAGHEKPEEYPLAHHLRRRLSDEEVALLSPDWLAIPPTDIGGESGPWR
jgi:hypothetical protein